MKPVHARQKRFDRKLKPLLAAVLLGNATTAWAQSTLPVDLTVEKPSFVGQTLKRNHVLEVRLSRVPTPAEGQIAICIGPLDLSKQTKALDATTFRAELNGAELPVGQHEVVVHLIRGSEWLDLAKFAVTVEGNGETAAKGLEKGLESRFTLGAKGQIHERVSGTTKPGARPQFQDMTVTGGINWEGKPLGWDLKSSANLTGVSRRTEAPRFSIDGVEAQKLDLNDYKVEFTRGDAKFALGHLSYGNHPLLLNNRDSRGVSLGYAITPWLDVSASAIRATSIVGFNDFFGLSTVSHRIYAATVGAELIPEKKGLLRAELLFMDARALPQSNINQGQVPDAEESRGLGVRVVSTDPDGRWKADALWARSRYVNPVHPDLAQGSTLVLVKPETRDAWQAEASYLLVKDAKWLGDKYPINVRGVAHYEYAEPLFKSLGASFLADQQLMRYSGELRVGEIALTLVGSDKNDNVTTIPKILKTGTYEKSAQLSVPLPGLFGTSDKPANYLPQMQLESRQVRQYTLRIPDGTNARSSFWPDQLNITHKAALNWNYEPYTVSYNFEIGDQDNRQPERERADFLIHTHGLTVAWKVHDKLNLNLGYNRSRNFSYEKSQATYNNGGTIGIDWQMSDVWSVKADYAKSLAFDSLNQQYSNTLAAALQIARKFTLQQFGKKLPGQVFVRVAFANNRALDAVVAQVLSGKQTLVQTGLSLNF
jgi:TonB dependent receptor